MRTILSIGFSIIWFSNYAQNVGIGAANPLSSLHVKGGLLLDSINGNTPVSGAGTRFMWIPSKWAFRAGKVTGTQWDDANVGEYSFAFGSNAGASGNSSIGIGNNATASNTNAVAIGNNSSASAPSSFVLGTTSNAYGLFSMVIGSVSTSSGVGSIALGFGNITKGDYSAASGSGLIAQSAGGMVVGIYNDTTNAGSISSFLPENRIFQVGNGVFLNRSNAMTILHNGKTGIGTTTPLGLLHVKNGALLADGTIGATPVSGPGSRMMWIPEKSAFRSGSVSADKPLSWNADSIGMNSFAAGYNAVASGNTSIALGVNSAATGYNSIALGNEVRASGNEALATGIYSKASGNSSTAMGYQSVASGLSSMATGFKTIASGEMSTATGVFTEATGNFSFAGGEGAMAKNFTTLSFGRSTLAGGVFSTAFGAYTKSKHFSGLVIGLYNDSSNSANPSGNNPANRLFQIGNGTADNARSNAMTVLQNGNIGIGTTTPVGLLHVKNGAVLAEGTIGATPVSGPGSRLMWIPEKSAFRAGSVSADKPLSWNPDSIGMNSFAAGYNAVASGNTSIAMGVNNAASGYNAIALGNGIRASGNESLATGYITVASGNQSTSMGIYSLASAFAATATGNGSIASGSVSFATGFSTEASGPISFSGGEASRANNYVSFSFGRSAIADGSISSALGYFTKAKHFSGLVIGTYNDSSQSPNASNINMGNRLFQIGNGTADNARSNAMTVLQNGNIGIGETNPVVPLNFNGSTGGKISLWGTTGNQYGFGIQPSLLQIYTDVSNSDIAFGHGNSASFTEKVRIKGNGNMGIGQNNPTSPLHFESVLGNKIALYGTAANQYGMGIQNNLLQIYADGINADIAFGYGNSNSFTERVRIKGIGNMEVKSGLSVLGSVAVAGNLTIENGKGIIRSSGTQTLKKVTTLVSINASINNSTSIAVNFNFPENFTGTPEAYVGNIVTNTSNGESMVMNLTNISATGGTLHVYNPRAGGGFSTVSFTVNIIAMGAQ